MFSLFRRSLEPTLQLYGKLPLAKDYLRIGCAAGAGLALREWLDASFSTRVEGDSAPTLPHPYRFLWPSRAGDPVLGVLWQSSDSGGLRPFPFALAVELPRRALTAELENGWSALDGWWSALERIHDSLGAHADGATLLAALRSVRVKPQDAADGRNPAEDARALDLESWIASIWPESRRAGLGQALAGIQESVRLGRVQPIRLPISRSMPLLRQCHAWWRVLVAANVFETAAAPLCFLACPVRETPLTFATFVARSPNTSDLDWLLDSTSMVPHESISPDAELEAPRALVEALETGMRAPGSYSPPR